jgi:hypothetical protein
MLLGAAARFSADALRLALMTSSVETAAAKSERAGIVGGGLKDGSDAAVMRHQRRDQRVNAYPPRSGSDDAARAMALNLDEGLGGLYLQRLKLG